MFAAGLAGYRPHPGLYRMVRNWGAPPLPVPAGEISGGARQWVETNPETYRELALRHAVGARAIAGPAGQ